MEKRKIIMVNPKTKELEYEVTRSGQGEVVFHVDLPRWGKKIQGLLNGSDALPDYRSGKPGFLNHSGIHPGTDIVVGNPYLLSFRDFELLSLLHDRFRVDVSVRGTSAWYPGHTLGVYLTATSATYAVLKLKPGVKAYCMKVPSSPDVAE